MFMMNKINDILYLKKGQYIELVVKISWWFGGLWDDIGLQIKGQKGFTWFPTGETKWKEIEFVFVSLHFDN
jgi:hypothetical protein